MKCYRCHLEAVLFQRYSGRHLCTDHLCADIESRAKRVIRQNCWLVRGDRIGVVMGLQHSDALWIFLSRLLGNRKDTRLIPLPVIKNNGEEDAKWFHALLAGANSSEVFRIALPDSADDLAEQTFRSILRGDADFFLNPGKEYDFPIMQPLREIPSEELAIYARRYQEMLSPGEEKKAPFTSESPFDSAVRTFLHTYSALHPSAPHALRRYLDTLRELSDVHQS